MVRSMTGYGRKEAERGGLRLTVEMRAVNHRYCEIVVRLPRTWGRLEDTVKKLVAQRVRRGRVDVFISIEQSTAQSSGLSINWDVAERYVQIARQLQTQFSLPESMSAKDLLTMPGVMQLEAESVFSVDEVAEWLTPLVEQAADELLAMKRAEGEKMYQDLTERLQQVTVLTEHILKMAPEAVSEFRKRLRQRIAEWTELQIDEQRVLQEIALFADRSDISEETIRLKSHSIQFAEQFGKDEAIGRKLEFLLQEMNREANTIGSKANYLPIQRLAVQIKTELEKMREQVQNVE